MAISDLYSHRKNKKAQSGESDVYQYDSIPGYVINQIIMILGDSIGNAEQYCEYIINTMAREYGDRSVNIWPSGRQSCVNFLTKPGNIDSELDIIEFAFKVIDEKIRNYAGVGYYGQRQDWPLVGKREPRAAARVPAPPGEHRFRAERLVDGKAPVARCGQQTSRSRRAPP
jgi:hypothetical protein